MNSTNLNCYLIPLCDQHSVPTENCVCGHWFNATYPFLVKVKVKVIMKAQRGSRSIALSIHNLGARRGWVVNATPWVVQLYSSLWFYIMFK
jgi:hypothetical protein